MPDASRTTRVPREELRRRLEDAAATLLASKGYANTTVDDIVEAAGVSKPALYRVFESKKQLHMTLLERHRHELAAAALGAGFAASGADAQLRAMVDAWFAYVEHHPFIWLLFQDTTGDPEVQALHRELQARQRAADVALLRQYAPGIPEDELEPLGESIRASLYGLAMYWRDHPGLPRSTLVASMTRVVRGILHTAT